jgi:hypothetical protein
MKHHHCLVLSKKEEKRETEVRSSSMKQRERERERERGYVVVVVTAAVGGGGDGVCRERSRNDRSLAMRVRNSSKPHSKTCNGNQKKLRKESGGCVRDASPQLSIHRSSLPHSIQ